MVAMAPMEALKTTHLETIPMETTPIALTILVMEITVMVQTIMGVTHMAALAPMEIGVEIHLQPTILQAIILVTLLPVTVEVLFLIIVGILLLATIQHL